jgi:hypothetical protein
VDEEALPDALARVGREYTGADAVPLLLSRPGSGAVVLRYGRVVLKAHAGGTDPAALAARLAAASGPGLAGVLLAPLSARLVRVQRRLVSVWPRGTTVPVDPAGVPWAAAAALLARLHAAALDCSLPPTGAPRRIAVPLSHRLRLSPEAATVHAAWNALPAWVRGQASAPGLVTVTHGDWHLGQLVAPADGGWRLADVDDLGIGTPVWDFARIAGLRAVGVVHEQEFRDFLDAYWAAGGPALRPGAGDAADPAGWAALDAVARADVVSTTARRLARADAGHESPDHLTTDLLKMCARLAAAPQPGWGGHGYGHGRRRGFGSLFYSS